MRRPHVPASRQSDAQSAHVAQARLADRQAACGHARYTKGCDLCALAGIYHDHMSRPDLTAAERSSVSRLYLAGDKAALFKLWQALPAADDS
jgi:hypothetical protein